MKSKIIMPFIIVLILAVSESSFGQLQKVHFNMGDFVIEVTELTSGSSAFNDVSDLARLKQYKAQRINQLLAGKKFNGKGSCRIIRNRLPVVFKDVELKFLPETKALAAISGKAIPSLGSQSNNTISYIFLGFPIKIDARTVVLRPQLARAAVTVCVSGSLFAGVSVRNYCLTSKGSEIGASGEVRGTNFRAGTALTFIPKGSSVSLLRDWCVVGPTGDFI